MSINSQRPNTGVDNSLLHENTIICCGEDSQELLNSLKDTYGENTILDLHQYRCYSFWKFKAFTLVWTGIGTGCLEPLLYEIFDCNLIKKVILIGTAGALRSSVELGEVYFISTAYLGGAAVRLPAETLPLRPKNFEFTQNNPQIKIASIVSTDYYYGFNRQVNEKVARLQKADRYLREDVIFYSEKASLVDMETAQFYHFCNLLRDSDLAYAAFKGAANSSEDVSLQTLYSTQVLTKGIRYALLAFADFSSQPYMSFDMK